MTRGRARPKRSWIALLAFVASGELACKRSGPSDEGTPAASASGTPGELSPELAKKVLAKVGDRVITLGDYAAALERMDPFERLRYQTPDRRRRLLEEMIDLELLSQEAERRGLDKQPETQELVRQLLREELLREVRSKLPPLSEIPMSEVRAYFDAHRSEYREPERRRVSHIVVADAATAKTVLEKAKTATPEGWGDLVKRHSLEPKRGGGEPEPPAELAGDLGMVTPPASGKSDNAEVPEPVRAAVFEIERLGSVLDRAVSHAGRYHIVRLTNVSPARERSLPEAERTIRVKLLREKILSAEEALEAELRKKHPAVVDERALSQVKLPGASSAVGRP